MTELDYEAHYEPTPPALDAAREALRGYSLRPGFTDAVERFEAAVRANERAGATRAAILREAVDCAREEGHRLEETAGIAHARGARSVAYQLRKLLVKAQPAAEAQP
ncbi:hypothetical protein [Streptomyces sp. NPDC058694]|uniref:hypothetical protein n=1 Tax=Streptomyces sp. NPDC058694 TaxID=3346603 RepID=UPI0036655501